MGINQISITEDRAAGGKELAGSLWFRNEDNEYEHLERTVTTASPGAMWTYSVWIKRSDIYGQSGQSKQTLMSAESGGSNKSFIRYNNDAGADTLRFYDASTGNCDLVTVSNYRDTNDWIHYVLAADTTLNTSGNRIKFYTNGQLYEGAYWSSGNTTSDHFEEWNWFKTSVTQYIGKSTTDASSYNTFRGGMSDVYLIDGIQLGPEHFGYTDPLTNIWRPKKFTRWDSDDGYKSNWSEMWGGTFDSDYRVTNGGSFNGTTTGYTQNEGSAEIHWTPSSPISISSSLQVYVTQGTSGQLELNDASVATTNNDWTEIATSGTLTKLSLLSGSGSQWVQLKAVKVDGVILDDSAGRNSFHLPMDGKHPIGADQSGKGNDWTPVNFGGSTVIPKATGALPILNTVSGGRVAVPGVRGQVGVAVTVYNSGSGNKYYLDGEEAKTLSYKRGQTVTFDTSDSTVSGHPFRFATAADAAGSTQYTTGSVTSASEGSVGAATTITFPIDAPETLYYYCTNHSGMGGSITGITTDIQVADPYASYCKLALPLVGNAVDVSNQINSGSATKTMTANGNAAASSQKSNFYSGSFYFDGNGDYLSTPDSTDWHLGTSEFTIECFIRKTANGTNNYDAAIATGVNGSYHDGWSFLTSTGDDAFRTSDGSTGYGLDFNNNSFTTDGKWHHIAVSRDSSNVARLFLDGIIQDEETWNFSIPDSSTPLYVGAQILDPGSVTFSFNGYIQDVRLYHICKYTENFIPASTDPDVMLDTPFGVSYETDYPEPTAGAVVFSGSRGAAAASNYLYAGTSSDFTVGSSDDFSFEAYIYPTSVSDTSLFGIGSSTVFGYRIISGSPYLYVQTTGGILNTGSIAANKWTHVAVTRSSGTLYSFIDGVLAGSVANTGSFSASGGTGAGTFIGAANLSAASPPNYSFTGQISNLRFVNGTAVYISDFTPPTAPLTNVTNTKLLCCQNKNDSSANTVFPTSTTACSLNIPCDEDTFADQSASSVSITDNSISVASAGTNTLGITTAAVLPGGSGDAIDTRGTDFDRTTAYTIDCYFNYDGSQQGRLVTNYNPGVTGNTDGADGQGITVATDGSINIYDYANAVLAPAGSVVNDTWYHLRFIANNTKVIATYLNGERMVDGTSSTIDNFAYDGPLQYGAGEGSTSHRFSGKLGPIRFTPGEYLGAPPVGGLVTTESVISNNATATITVTGTSTQATGFNPFDRESKFTLGKESGYATWNPLASRDICRKGDLKLDFADASTSYSAAVTDLMMPPNSGGWYYEYTVDYQTGSSPAMGLHSMIDGRYIWGGSAPWYFGSGDTANNDFVNAGVTTANSGIRVENPASTGQTVSVRYDATNRAFGYSLEGGPWVITTYADNDSHKIHMYENTWYSFVAADVSNDDVIMTANFGQKPFKYPPPEGFRALCRTNLPRPGVNDPQTVVGITSYTGDMTAAQPISGFKFAPDLVLLKSSTDAYAWRMGGPVLGVGNALGPNVQDDMVVEADGFVSFDESGFTLGSNTGTSDTYHNTGDKYVAFTWKAGGSKGTWNIDGTSFASASAAGLDGGTIDPTYASVGTKQGFGIYKYTGNGTSGADIVHGLSQAPDLIIAKNLDENSTQWLTSHRSAGLTGDNITGTSVPEWYEMYLNSDTNRANNGTDVVSPDGATKITLGSGDNINKNTISYIMLAWHNVTGVQKFGTYIGSGAVSSGPYVYLGFKPAFVIIKNASAYGGWRVFDNQNNTSNWEYGSNTCFAIESVDAVTSYSDRGIDLLADGFKVRSTSSWNNTDGSIYLYMAWADSNVMFGGQSNAR